MNEFSSQNSNISITVEVRMLNLKETWGKLIFRYARHTAKPVK